LSEEVIFLDFLNTREKTGSYGKLRNGITIKLTIPPPEVGIPERNSRRKVTRRSRKILGGRYLGDGGCFADGRGKGIPTILGGSEVNDKGSRTKPREGKKHKGEDLDFSTYFKGGKIGGGARLLW